MVALGMLVAGVPGGAGATARRAARPRAASPRVLRVGSYRGSRGQFTSIQAAVDAAQPGDWILVGPGDYHEQADHRTDRGSQPDDTPAGVVITKPGIHLRGMDRNGVVVDGTLPGTGPACASDESRQDLGVSGSDGKPLGRNGILVYKADGVSVDNLTVCNFLGGAGRAGNEIWFNGGDGSGKIGMGAFSGAYLNATSTFFKDESTAATYGIFSSNASGPGVWDNTYASNFNDSSYYIGACAQVCNQTMNHAHAQYSALGYSGTNSGGPLVIENSEFDHNKDGFDTNSQNNDDAPSPQDGACPNGATSPITHTHSCWVFMHNYVHDNNDPNVPGSGAAAAGPVGTGMSVSGARNNTIMDNRFDNNGAWGIILVPYPDTETPPDTAHCEGGVNTGPPSNACLYDDWGNEIAGNTFHNNGFFGNDTNSDFGEITTTGPNPTNCFHGNVEQGGGQVTSSPSGLQQSKPACNTSAAPDPNPSMTNQVACDSQFFASLLPTGSGTPCPPGSSYPTQTQVVMHPLPTGLQTMPQPCAGVPANPWCVAPVIHSIHMTPRVWRRGTPLPRATRRRPIGTTIRVNLNEAATLRLAFSHARTGRRVGRRCVAPSRANRHRRACVRTVSAGSMSFHAHAGINRIRFQGRLSRRNALRPGRYKLAITATDGAGSRSRPRVLAFTVLAR
jgi:hypothetical protein